MRSARTRFRVGKRLRRASRAAVWVASLVLLAGCATTPQHHGWENRLQGNNVVLLGELHDNAEHHRQRLEVLRRAFAAGWRPAIAMEQFDRERQADIDRARREPEAHAQRVIDAAVPPKGRAGGNWNWDFYRPFVALALEYDVPLLAVNLSNTDAARIVREGLGAVFDTQMLRRLKLDQPAPAERQRAQEREIDIGHCNALPAKTLPAMALAQMARDAVMADLLANHQGRGVVLIAGNGHVRRDIGVPAWFDGELRTRTLAVGYLEQGVARERATVFDAVVYAPAVVRDDPCLAFRKRIKTPQPQ